MIRSHSPELTNVTDYSPSLVSSDNPGRLCGPRISTTVDAARHDRGERMSIDLYMKHVLANLKVATGQHDEEHVCTSRFRKRGD